MSDQPQQATSYRWFILLLGTLTNTLVVAAPSMGLPVLFDEISRDLHLDLVQIGLVWGIIALPGIVTIFLGGVLGDRFGPKRVLIAACVLIGLTGALRGLANSFPSLLVTMFLSGLVTPMITTNTLKSCGTWFPRQQLGLASGVLSMGMAFGFLLGSMFSATLLSPWLGGWRNVLFFYGGIAILLGLPWFLTRQAEGYSHGSTQAASASGLGQTIGQIARIRNIWLYGLAIMGIGGCIQGTLGYLPLYLRGQGWPVASADGALAAFHLLSLAGVIPIAIASDRLGSRKKVLLAASATIICGVTLISLVNGPLVWIAVGMAGMVRDGFMAVFMSAIIETDGVGPAYAGTAIGLVMILSGIGNLLAPPLGNSLASISPGLPFLFWAGLTVFGLLGLLATNERQVKPTLAPQQS